MRSLARMVACLALPLCEITAQAPDSLLVSGARVRVWTRSRAFVRREGRVLARQGDSLDLRLQYPLNDQRTGSEYARVTLIQLDSAQVRVKTGWTARRSSNTGIAIGAAVGAIVGLMAVTSPVADNRECEPVPGAYYMCPQRVSPGTILLTGMLTSFVGAIIGGTTGGLLGALKSERWEAVRLPGR